MIDERRLHEDNLAFLARIGADISHEMRNVLSVIGEQAGLLDDLLALAENGKPLDYARLKKLARDMTIQVKKGTETMERFSRFAHAADEQTALIDLTAVTATVAALAERHVTRAGCTLQTELPVQALYVSTSPFSLQRAVFSAIQLMLESAGSSGRVLIKLADRGHAAEISVSCDTPGFDEQRAPITQLSVAMAELKGKIEEVSEAGKSELILSLPKE